MFRRIQQHDSLMIRIILLALTTIGFSVVLFGLVVTWKFQQTQEHTLSTYLEAHIDMLIAWTSLDETGKVTINHATDIFPDMPFYWQVTTAQEPLAKSLSIEQWIPVDDIQEGLLQRLLGAEQLPVTMVAKIVIFPGQQRVTYLFGLPSQIMDAFLKEERTTFVTTLFMALTVLILFLVIVMTVVQLWSMTVPLQKIKQEIIQVRSGKKTKIQGSFPKEIRMLVHEVNHLIAYNIATIERYSTFVANVSHALKTPLTIINNEAQKSKTVFAKQVKDKMAEMVALIDRNVARVKMVGRHKTLLEHLDIVDIITRITAGFSKVYQKNLQFDECVGVAKIYGNKADFYELLGNIIENAFKYGKSQVQVSLFIKEDKLTVRVDDDGSGIAEHDIKRVIQYGVRLDESKPGSGIGLAVAQHIITLYEGHIAFHQSVLGGLGVEVTLPLS